MSNDENFSPINSALVTGATGLLGNNLVRLLVSRGVHVKALVRSREKAETQLAGLPVEIVVGQMTNVRGFANELNGVDVIFHTAAYFRDNYRGGKHWKQLFGTNVQGTAHLFAEAYKAGVRRIVHTSSVAVLSGAAGELIDETMRRSPEDADNYYRSKILADCKVDAFLEAHADWGLHGSTGLDGWAGDMGPTSLGQVSWTFASQAAGLPASHIFGGGRADVAEATWLATQKGRRGERYLAAGQPMSLGDLYQKLEQISGIAAPRWNVPLPVLYVLAAANEIWTGITKRPALISLATVRLMGEECERTHFNAEKSERELGIQFRPVAETLSDTMRWYQQNGWQHACAKEQVAACGGAASGNVENGCG